MLEYYTKLRSAVRRLRSPISRGYNSQEWKSVVEQFAQPTLSDINLIAAAPWFFREASSLRAVNMKAELNLVGGELYTLLAIATANLEQRKVSSASREQTKAAFEKGAIDLDFVLKQPMKNALPGDLANADGMIEAIIESAEIWLFDARQLAVDGKPLPADAEKAAAYLFYLYSIQRGLNDQWNSVMWEDWHLTASGGALHLKPGNPSLCILRHAWNRRHESNMGAHLRFALTNWANMDSAEKRRTLRGHKSIELRHRKGARSLRVITAPPPKRAPHFFVASEILTHSYLAQFLETSFPGIPWLSVMTLLRAWSALIAVAEAVKAEVKWDAIFDEEFVRKAALTVTRRELEYVMQEWLGVDVEQAGQVLDFLTFDFPAYRRSGNRGLWAAPLVAIPGTASYALPEIVLTAASMSRSVEAWLERGGLNDNQLSSRGVSYERQVRSSYVTAIAQNELFSTAVCLPDAVKRKDVFREEIDLFIKIGQLLIVGDTKFFLFPADSYEIHNHFDKIKKAAAQALRKAEAVKANRQGVATKLSISIEEAEALTVLPVVVLNQGFGLGLNIDGVIITAADYLRHYLTDAQLFTSAAMDHKTGAFVPEGLIFYSSESEAADRFLEHFETPKVLRKFSDRMSFRASSFPTSEGQHILVDTLIYSDMDAKGQAEANALIARMERISKAGLLAY